MTYTGLTTAQEDAIHDWVAAAVGSTLIQIIWGYPDEDKLDKTVPICVLSVISRPNQESAPALKYKTTDTFSHIFDNVFTLSVKFFSNSDHDYRKDLSQSQYFDTVKEAFKVAGLTIRKNLGEYSTIIALNAHFEMRVGIDFQFATCEAVDETIPEMQSVVIESTFTTEDNRDIKSDINITNL